MPRFSERVTCSTTFCQEEWPPICQGTPMACYLRHYAELERAVADLRSIYDEHAGLQDRFREAGFLKQELAEKLGVIGLVGRASGIGCDLRVDHPWPPYDKLDPKAGHANFRRCGRARTGAVRRGRRISPSLPSAP